MEDISVIKVEDVSMKYRMNSDNARTLKNFAVSLTKGGIQYKTFCALNNVSFSINKGEVIGIIGRNGSGKSTILKIISGILKPTRGKIVCKGNIVPMLELGTGFDFELTGKENIFLNGAVLGYSKEVLLRHYNDIVEFSELGDFINEPIRNYSSGMMMRLAFSIATIVKPDILIVDEILSVGDASFKEKSAAKMKELMAGGTTVIIVSHVLEQIRSLCNRVIWLDDGKIVLMGDTNDVCDKYKL